MKSGDIVVYFPRKSASWVSRAISWIQPRFGQGGNKDLPSASHISILAENVDYEYESTVPFYRYHKISDKDKVNFDIWVYRYKGITDNQRENIIDYCKCVVNQPWYKRMYGIEELLTLGLYNLKFMKACSEFVGYIYMQAGITLGDNPDEYLLSPNEIIYNTSSLEKVYEFK